VAQLEAGYTQADMLAHLSFCRREVDERVPRLNLEAESGFARRQFDKFELQIYSIRHVMQHAGELMERLGARAGVKGTWVGSMHGRSE
jgi:hypothetical protein